jgi:hypothetical protein
MILADLIGPVSLRASGTLGVVWLLQVQTTVADLTKAKTKGEEEEEGRGKRTYPSQRQLYHIYPTLKPLLQKSALLLGISVFME